MMGMFTTLHRVELLLFIGVEMARSPQDPIRAGRIAVLEDAAPVASLLRLLQADVVFFIFLSPPLQTPHSIICDDASNLLKFAVSTKKKVCHGFATLEEMGPHR